MNPTEENPEEVEEDPGEPASSKALDLSRSKLAADASSTRKEAPETAEQDSAEGSDPGEGSEDSADEQEAIDSEPSPDSDADADSEAAPPDNGEPDVSETAAEAEDAEPEGKGSEEEPEDDAPEPDPKQLQYTLEALLFASETPLNLRELARAASSRSATVRKALKELEATYENEKRAWQLVEVAGGYQLATREIFFEAIQKLKAQRAHRKLTQAALETLALIAYSKEPVSRAEVESVRGVGAGPVLRQLLERKLIKIAGRGTGLGQPLLYGVTIEFLEHFGLKSADELPRASEFKNI